MGVWVPVDANWVVLWKIQQTILKLLKNYPYQQRILSLSYTRQSIMMTAAPCIINYIPNNFTYLKGSHPTHKGHFS